ncbi:MAG: hypothetical protein NTV39_02655 [Candidatus Saccharibacteria bacterium]|nr:hypothetical protein [Candidatus Saccharibacteria bacterium]
MDIRLFLRPPEIIEVDSPVIFLAGPIQGAPDWQSEARKIIHKIDESIVVASPRGDFKKSKSFVYEKQVDWETHYLREAGKNGVVLFWLAGQTTDTPGRSFAQTSRFELAEWKVRHERDGVKLTIGIDENFGNARYIRRRFSQDAPDVQIADSLVETCKNAVNLLNKKF